MSTTNHNQEIYRAAFPAEVTRLRSGHLGMAINNIFRSLEGLHGEQQIKLQIISNPVKAPAVEAPVIDEPEAKIIQFPTGQMMQEDMLAAAQADIKAAFPPIEMETQNDSAQAA